VKTHRDAFAVNFNRGRVAKNMEAMIDAYNSQVNAYKRLKQKPVKIEDFINYESNAIAWSELLKKTLERGVEVEFDDKNIRPSNYRPYTSTWLYFDSVMNERRYGFPNIFPKINTKNTVIWLKVGSDWPMFALMSNRICDLMPQGGSQCFPVFTYSEDSKERRDNITAKALTLFQIFYDDDRITREDIFHYVYALLHHPAYRTRYAENLKRELPRIPFVGVPAREHSLAPSDGERVGVRDKTKNNPTATPSSVGGEAEKRVAVPGTLAAFFPLAAVEKMQGDATPDHNPKASAKLFHTFATAGKQLADLHVNYESAKEFKLNHLESKEAKLDWRVEAMKLTKDKSAIIYNDFLTLTGIPAGVYEYRLGNRSALEWVIDQYRVTRDEKGNIASDPNRMDDEQYIVRLLAQVITVSLETVKWVQGLPTVEK
jgi:predicted helicase